MVLSFSDSFVRASSTETSVTANSHVGSSATTSRPPWFKTFENPDVLPRSLYPILPPPQPAYARVQPITMSRHSSSVTVTADSAMADAQIYEDEDEDVDGTPLDATTLANYALASPATDSNGLEDEDMDNDTDMDDQDSGSEFEVDYESEDDTLETFVGVRTRSMKKGGNATRVKQAVNKRIPRKRTNKAGKKKATSTIKKAPATGGSTSDGPARRTRSSTSSQAKAQITGYDGVDLRPLKGKYKTRKTWNPTKRATLRKAIQKWWADSGAAAFHYPRKIRVPKKNGDEGWFSIWAECKKLDSDFNQSHLGLATIARKMWQDGRL